MKEDFFTVVPPQTVLSMVDRFTPVELEDVPLARAHGRVLGRDIVITGDLPGFARSTMDGFAVRAAATFGASETNPVYLERMGAVVMGEAPGFCLGAGQAAEIPTGGMMPEGADSVVIIEHTRLIDNTLLEIFKSAAPGENVIAADEDFKKGDIALPGGVRVRSQEAGLLAALGIVDVTVFRKPTVGIISTGDEVVPAEETPAPGRVRDVNTYTLAALAEEAGARPVIYGIVDDHPDHLKEKTAAALAECDMVLLSGGSSLGTRDFTLEVINSLPDSELLVRGIAIRPGKPTLLARISGKPFWGLPGQVASAMVIFSVIVRPFIDRLAGVRGTTRRFNREISALTARNIPSVSGREDYIRVRLEEKEGVLLAWPVFGKSGLLNTMTAADGLIVIDADTEGLKAGTPVSVKLF
ncbi:MAG: gephyrin-like molybdotransferase Glp [Thermodesulfobacteriota bacterium]